MSSASLSSNAPPISRHRRLNLFANLVLLFLLVAGIAIWRFGIPLVERTLQNIGGAIASVAMGAAQVMDGGIDQSYAAVTADPWVRQHLGTPVTFPPLEDVQWTATTSPEELAFSLQATGPRASATVRGRMRFEQHGAEIVALEIDDGETVRTILLP